MLQYLRILIESHAAYSQIQKYLLSGDSDEKIENFRLIPSLIHKKPDSRSYYWHVHLLQVAEHVRNMSQSLKVHRG